MECLPEIFKQFEEGCDGYLHPDQAGQSFLQDALGEELEFSGLVYLPIPELDDRSFLNWDQFEYWCDAVRPGLLDKILDEDKYAQMHENSTPRDYFETKANVRDNIISVETNSSNLSSSNLGLPPVSYIEISSMDKKLILVLEDLDCWALGYDGGVMVFKTLDELVPENDFYPLKL